MQELVGRLTAIDPDATESVKIISYFDTRVAGDARLETIVRGAATLSGAIAGLDTERITFRVDPKGVRRDIEDPPSPWPSIEVLSSARVWIERDGEAHASDSMLLERFALAVGVLLARRTPLPDDAVRIAVDAARPVAQRLEGISRLRLSGQPLRVVATRPEVAVPGPHSLIVTAHGILRATIVSASEASPQPGSGPGESGWGAATDGAGLPSSWADAIFTYRISRATGSAVDAADMGVLLEAARLAEEHGAGTHPDVTALARLGQGELRVLDAAVAAESIRSAAKHLGIHHSTLQARYRAFVAALGYDPRSATGAARYAVSRTLDALSRTI